MHQLYIQQFFKTWGVVPFSFPSWILYSPALVFSWMNFVAKSLHRVFHDAEIRSLNFLSPPSPEFRGSLSSKMLGFHGFSIIFGGSHTQKPRFPRVNPDLPWRTEAVASPRRVPPGAGTCCWKSTADTAPTTRWSPRRWGWHETMTDGWKLYEHVTLTNKNGDLTVKNLQ